MDGAATETIGQRLRRLRLERGLSQRQLSAPGVSYAYISRIEAGDRQPSVKALRKLAAKLQVSPEYLETGSDLGAGQRREMELIDAELQLRLADGDTTQQQALHDTLIRLSDEAREAGDRSAGARALAALGFLAAEQGDHGQAAAHLEDALATEPATPLTRPDVYATLGRAYAAQGRQEEAVRLWRECVDRVAEEAPDDLALRTRFATYVSYALADLGRYGEAQEVLSDVLERASGLADPYTQIRLYWSLARLLAMEGKPAAALGYSQRAIGLLEATEDSLQLARAHLLAGGILNLEGKGDEAVPHLTAADAIFRQNGDPFDLGLLRTEQAKAAVLRRDAGEAVSYGREAAELLADADPAERGNALHALAEGLALEGDRDGARRSFAEAVELLESQSRWREASEAARGWGKFLRAAGDESAALEVLDRAAALGERAVPPPRAPARP